MCYVSMAFHVSEDAVGGNRVLLDHVVHLAPRCLASSEMFVMAVTRKSTGVISKNQPGARGAHSNRAQALIINDRKSFGLSVPVPLW